jgi:predicted phosphoribosyltransferase
VRPSSSVAHHFVVDLARLDARRHARGWSGICTSTDMDRDGRRSGTIGFRDRRDGGRRLIAPLARHRGQKATIVLGLPRGGVVPAAEIARALELPLDVLISRKIPAPDNPELAIGAIAEGGETWLNPELVAATGATPDYVEAATARQRAEIAQRQQRFRGGRELALPAHATVILVDDGVATGATVIAGIHALRTRRVARLVLAIPVAPVDTAQTLRELVDELVVLATPEPFYAVGAFYDDFRQVTDENVVALLAEAGAGGGAPRAPTPA